MICEICDTIEAKHTIQGWAVCGSSWCKYVAWKWTPKQQAPEGWDKTPAGKPVRPRNVKSRNELAAERYIASRREKSSGK